MGFGSHRYTCVREYTNKLDTIRIRGTKHINHSELTIPFSRIFNHLMDLNNSKKDL